MRTYKLIPRAKGSFMLTVPPEIGRLIPAGVVFTVELTEEGLLYRPVSETSTERELPAWVSPEK